MEPDEHVIRLTSDEAQADDWHLALLSDELPHRLEEVDGQWALIVLERDRAWATEMLDDYDAERRERAEAPPAPAAPDAPSRLGIASALLLLGFHFFVVGVGAARWLAAGESDAALVLHGQPWRAVTALTLHADWVHVGGNAVVAAILFTALGRWVGSGVGAWLVLLAGAAGNFANAALHGGGHSSIGASTATFAAVGLLAALQLRRRRAAGARRMRAFIPIAGALGLVAMLGTGGPNTDVLAHVFGLACGLAVGAVAAVAIRRRLGAVVQALLSASALGAIVACWLLALR
jgi:rhomboid protease GluP